MPSYEIHGIRYLWLKYDFIVWIDKRKHRRCDSMKFRDLFLPKIARSDPEVRKKAVRQEKNVELLKKVIQNDKDPEVRRLAQKQLKKLAV